MGLIEIGKIVWVGLIVLFFGIISWVMLDKHRETMRYREYDRKGNKR